MPTPTDTYKDIAIKEQVDQLTLEHLEYVRHILCKIVLRLPDGVDAENLESAGVLGLVEAARQYDSQRGVAFKTYAYPRIRGAILDELRRNCPLPQQMLQQITRVRRACERLQPPVTPEAIALETNMSSSQVEQCLDAMRLSRLDVWEDSIAKLSSVRDHRTTQPSSAVELSETKRVLANCIEKLPEQERLVITLYHLEDMRLKEIGRVLKLSESRISRILAKAEFRLKEYVRAGGG